MSNVYELVRGQQTEGTWAHTGKLIVSCKLATGVLGSVTLPDDFAPLTVPDGSITSAKIADGTIQTVDIGNAQVTSAKLASGAAATNVGTLSGVLGGTLPSPTMAAGAAASNVGALGGSLSGTLPNPTLAANSVGASQITDGTVGTAELANAAVTNAKLASDTARANQLTNGGFEVWQRGNGGFAANGAWTADRWTIQLAGTDTMSVSKDTTNMDTSSKACAACTFTLSGGAGSSNLYQPLAFAEWGFGAVLSLSVRVKTSTANAVRVGIINGAVPTYSAFHTGNGAYQTLTVTCPAVTSATGYLQIYFAASCTAYLDNAMLVVGSQPCDYVHFHPADDLARCLRYYEKVGPSGNYPQISTYTSAGGGFFFPVPWAAKKAVTPTVTINGTFAYVNASGATIAGAGTVDGASFGATATALGSCIVYSNNSGFLAAIEPVSVKITDFAIWEYVHDDAPGGSHAGMLDPATLTYGLNADGSDNLNVIVVPCPECGAVSFWPPGGGADALLGQSLHVVVAMKQPAARGARAVQDVVAEVKARVVAMDGEARWVLDDTALQALEAPS